MRSEELWVCFAPPAADPPPHVLVLSFMSPSDEAAMAERGAMQVVGGREAVQEVRPHARAEYVQLIARVGATPCADGRTLRQLLYGTGGYSRWWLLDPTEKDCLSDDDPLFATVLQLMAVERVKQRYEVSRVRVMSAAPEFAAALGLSSARPSTVDTARDIATGILSRVALAVEYLRLLWILSAVPAAATGRRDVMLQGYWDWTVRSLDDGTLRDRYFSTLPGHLAAKGLTVGWLASCEPRVESWQQGRKTRDVVSAASAHPQVTLLERYLTPVDVARTAFNFSYPIRVTRVIGTRSFRTLCRIGSLDLYSIVRRQLLRAVWGGTFCRLQLVAAATARACRQLHVSVVLTSFELFLRSRALYAGARAASSTLRVWAAQHAGYSNDKTLGVFDAETEVRGTPDGCAVPAPDGLFVMGDLSRRIWEANGFARERVVVTGGLRYQHVRIEPQAIRAPSGSITLLLVGGMHEAAHVDLCDAALAAASGLPVRVLWRDHPNYHFSRREAFRRFASSMTVTSGTLDQDLAAADVLLFSQTGVAEEAVLRGIPTWQWQWPGFNVSPFLDLPVIPSFTSVAALRSALASLLDEPAPYRPTRDVQERVLHECFGPDPAGASGRIADAVHRMIAADAPAVT
jgi:surface carbohydrate biosynthesis protein (TIGR04326 family)